MPSYPGAVKSFTSKSAGQVIQPVDINDLQDEVNALESGLLNGTAPLTSSRAIVASLDVAGLSTLHGTADLASVNVSGTLNVNNVAATVNVLGNLAVGVPSPSVRVTNSTTTAVGGAGQAINFTVETFQVGGSGQHSTSAATSKLVAISSGIYLIAGNVEFQASSLGSYRLAQIRIDGSSVVAQVGTQPTAAAQLLQLNPTAIYRFASSGSYAELLVGHDAGVGLSINVTGDFSPSFMMTKLR